MRHVALLALLAVALAAPPALAADTLAVGGKVLSAGDPIGRVYDVLGPPDRSVDLENKFGARLGERLEYYRNGKTIQIEIRGGVIASIYEST